MIREAFSIRQPGLSGGAIWVALVATLVAAGATAGTDAAPALAACPKASVPATELGPAALRKATTCRINHLRQSRGRDRVRSHPGLRRVAQRHTRKMVETQCLKHRCPGEKPLGRRIRQSGYLAGARRWKFAQNTGCAVTAKAMVRNWRQSKFHRRNMLRRRFEHIGTGGVPRATHGRCGDSMATFTALLAWRVP